MATTASAFSVLALVAVTACSRARSDDEPQAKPKVATISVHPNGYSLSCRSYTAALVHSINALLVMLVRPSHLLEELRTQPPCR